MAPEPPSGTWHITSLAAWQRGSLAAWQLGSLAFHKNFHGLCHAISSERTSGLRDFSLEPFRLSHVRRRRPSLHAEKRTKKMQKKKRPRGKAPPGF